MGIVIKRTGFDQFLNPDSGAYIKCLIMGDHGVGKTPSAVQWPKPIVADCEKGLMSVASNAVPYTEVGGTKEMEELIKHLKLDSRKAKANRLYETLIIDTIDTYQRKMIHERLAMEQKESISGWADWGWLDAKMQQLMEALVSLDMNIVVNMHTKDITEGDDDDRQIIMKARLKGDIKDSIFQEFDLIGHMEQSYEMGTGDKKGERVRTRQVRWHSEPRFPSLRDRSNRLPRFTPVTFTERDYWNLFEKITEGLDAVKPTEVIEQVGDQSAVAEPKQDAAGGPVPDAPLPATKKTTVKKKAAATPVAEQAPVVAVAASEPEDRAEVAALQKLGISPTKAAEAVAQVEAEDKAAAAQAAAATGAADVVLHPRAEVIAPCPLVIRGMPHHIVPMEAGMKGGKVFYNQTCEECNLREVDLSEAQKTEQAELLGRVPDGQDPWAPLDNAATADDDAAADLLADLLGAEEVPETMDLSGQQTNGKGTAEEPVFLPDTLDIARESKVKEMLEHVHSSDGSCLKNTFGAKCGEEPAAPVPAPEPVNTGGPRCGDQPASMKGRKEALPGCGEPLNSQTNAKRGQIAMLRLGTFLCDNDHDAVLAKK